MGGGGSTKSREDFKINELATLFIDVTKVLQRRYLLRGKKLSDKI